MENIRRVSMGEKPCERLLVILGHGGIRADLVF